MGNCMLVVRKNKIHDQEEHTSWREGSQKPFLEKMAEREGVQRIKLVVSKAEVALLLSQGLFATQEMMLLQHLRGEMDKLDNSQTDSPESSSHRGATWTPALDSIPE